jgi:MazG family protein
MPGQFPHDGDMTRQAKSVGRIDALLALMRTLRDPKRGCPWDRVQSFETIAPYTIEEAYEVADAIARNDMKALKEELGDLLFQVVFHAEMAAERGSFDFAAVVSALVEKMERRHPHVFGTATIDTAHAQSEAWEVHKEHERRATKGLGASILDGVPLALPALARALKIQRRLKRVGFDWPNAQDALGKLKEELSELEHEMAAGKAPARLAAEVGDLLFACANVSRLLDIDAEVALQAANRKVERRFREVEKRLEAQGKTPESAMLAEMDALWNDVKLDERG